MNINRIIISGNLVADPTLRETNSGTPVASATIANNEFFNDGNGERHRSLFRSLWRRIRYHEPGTALPRSDLDRCGTFGPSHGRGKSNTTNTGRHSALGYPTPTEFAGRQNPKWGVVSKDLNNPTGLFTTGPARADRFSKTVSPAPNDILGTTP